MRGAALTKRCSIHRTQQGFWCPAVPLRWVYTPSTPLETHHSFHALLARSLATIFETGTSIWNVGKRIPTDGNDSARGKTENEKKHRLAWQAQVVDSAATMPTQCLNANGE